MFDTADVYGLGRSEIELSRALGKRRHEAFIITKFGVRWQTPESGGRAKTFRDSSPAYLRSALEGSLRRLKVEAIPLYLVHWPDVRTRLEDTLATLELMRQQGKILNFGLSNFEAPEVTKAAAYFSVSAVEAPFSLIERESGRAVFQAAGSRGMACFAYGTLAQGLLTGKYDAHAAFGTDDRRSRLPHFTKAQWQRNETILRIVGAISRRHQRSYAEIAIRWVLDSGYVDSAIVGAKSPRQVESNVSALNWKLPLEDMQTLEKKTLLSGECTNGCEGLPR